METSPVTCHTLEEFYHIDGHTFEKQYKETLSGFRDWEQLDHADEWMFSGCNKQILNRHFSVKLNHRLIIETISLYY